MFGFVLRFVLNGHSYITFRSTLNHITHAQLSYKRIHPHRKMESQMVKHLPAMQETWVRFLGREDPLEKEMAIHSSTVAWKIPWTEEPDRLQSMGSQRVGHD